MGLFYNITKQNNTSINWSAIFLLLIMLSIGNNIVWSASSTMDVDQIELTEKGDSQSEKQDKDNSLCDTDDYVSGFSSSCIYWIETSNPTEISNEFFVSPNLEITLPPPEWAF